VQGVKKLTALARRRCTDEKAAVRKTAVQLLGALLLLRAGGSGGVLVAVPSVEDIGAIRVAAADPMVLTTRYTFLADPEVCLFTSIVAFPELRPTALYVFGR
jgi:hypothetical protein